MSLAVTMRIKDFAIGKALKRLARSQRRKLLVFALDAPAPLRLSAWRNAARARRDVIKIKMRSRAIRLNYFNLNIYSNESCMGNFRFRIQDIGKVSSTMNWNKSKSERNGYRCDPITASCIVFRRLAAPCRWKDIEFEFGMRTSALSEIFWEAVEGFVESKGNLIRDLRENLLRERAALYSNAVSSRGAPLESCVGFIDCTKIRMTRPGGHGSMQRSCYSGHKRMHCLIYQTVTTPDGIIFSMYGPEVGRRHDTTLLRQSGLEDRLEQCLLLDGRQFYVYGDAAYMTRPWLQTAFERLGATPSQEAYNKSMSAVRVTVEWNYKDLKQQWSLNDYARSLSVRKAPIALLYQASALLLNFKTCLENGGQVGTFFHAMLRPWSIT